MEILFHLSVQRLKNDGIAKMFSLTAEDEKFMKIKSPAMTTCVPVLSMTFSSLKHT